MIYNSFIILLHIIIPVKAGGPFIQFCFGPVCEQLMHVCISDMPFLCAVRVLFLFFLCLSKSSNLMILHWDDDTVYCSQYFYQIGLLIRDTIEDMQSIAHKCAAKPGFS